MRRILSIFALLTILLALYQFSASTVGADRGGEPLTHVKIASDLGGDPLIQVPTNA